MQGEQSGSVTLSVADVARLFGLTREHMYHLVQRGEIRSVRLGRRIVIPRTVVDELLAGNAKS